MLPVFIVHNDRIRHNNSCNFPVKELRVCDLGIILILRYGNFALKCTLSVNHYNLSQDRFSHIEENDG